MPLRLTYIPQDSNQSNPGREVQPTREHLPTQPEPVRLERVRSGDGELTVWGEIDLDRGEVTFYWQNSSPGRTVLVFRVRAGDVPEYARAPSELKFTENWTSGERQHWVRAKVDHGEDAHFIFETREDFSFIDQVFSFARQPESKYMNLVHMHVRMPERIDDRELRDLEKATVRTKKQADLERARKELEELTAPPPDRVTEFMEAVETDLRLMESMDHLDDRTQRYLEKKIAVIQADGTLSQEMREERIRGVENRMTQFREKHGL